MSGLNYSLARRGGLASQQKYPDSDASFPFDQRGPLASLSVSALFQSMDETAATDNLRPPIKPLWALRKTGRPAMGGVRLG